MTESTARPIQRVAVIGAGTMGAQIAALTAFSGRDVAIFDAAPGATERGLDRIRGEILPGIEQAGFIGGSPVETLTRMRAASSLADAVDGVDLVIEAVREEIGTKRSVFTELSRL